MILTVQQYGTPTRHYIAVQHVYDIYRVYREELGVGQQRFSYRLPELLLYNLLSLVCIIMQSCSSSVYYRDDGEPSSIAARSCC